MPAVKPSWASSWNVSIDQVCTAGRLSRAGPPAPGAVHEGARSLYARSASWRRAHQLIFQDALQPTARRRGR